MNLQYLQHSPFREPAWRHDYVVRTLRAGRDLAQSQGDDDAAIRSYRRFLIALRAAGADHDDRNRVFCQFPNVGGAYQLFYAADQEDRRQLEARLMTIESLAQIADRFQTDPYLIQSFEQIFYNVRDRLSSRDWVHIMLLKPPAPGPLATKGLVADELRWHQYRKFAYCGGPHVLDALISGGTPVEKPKNAGELDAWLENGLHDTMQKFAVTTAVTLDPSNMLPLVNLALTKTTTMTEDSRRQADLAERNEKIFKAAHIGMGPRKNKGPADDRTAPGV